MKRQLLSTLLLSVTAFLMACGGSSTTTDDVPDTVAETTGGDLAEDVANQCLEPGGLNSLVPDEIVLAGDPVTISCLVPDCPDWPVAWSLAVGGDADKITVSGTTVTFLVPGTYEVACIATTTDGETFQDSTPAEVNVDPGMPASVTTALDVESIQAGETLAVHCRAEDDLGNPIYGPFQVLVSPEEGTKVNGLLITPTQAGEVGVTCLLDSIHDGNTVPLTVESGMPARLYTELSDEEVVAGKSVNISCHATDNYDNKVTGFPMVVYVPPELSLAGLSISGTLAGFYEVKCVPQAEQWGLFQLFPAILTVGPAAPAQLKLTLVPDKSVYKLLDKVLLQAAVRDAYGNLVPDALVTVKATAADGLPTDGLVETQPMNYKFVSEGSYKFMLHVTADPAVKAERVVNVDGSGPLLAIDYPGRGETIGDKPSVTVTGTVSDEVTGLESFTINDEEVSVELDNSFSHIVLGHHAVNLLVAEALDAGGETTRTTRAFGFSNQWYPAAGSDEETWVPGGLQLFLSENFIDDGNHDPNDPDDLATLLEVMLANLDFATLIPNPVYNANSYKVFVKNVTLDAPVVAMTLVEGGITVDIQFKNLSADVDAIGSCSVLGIDLCPDVSGTLSIDDISLYATMDVGLAGDQVVAAIQEFHLGITGFELDLSGIGSLLDPIINGVIGLFEQQVEAALATQLENMLPDLVAGLFGQFQLDQNITVPGLVEGAEATNVSLKTKYSELLFSPSGIKMSFATRATSTKKVVHDPLGSLGRGSCAGPDAEPYELPTTSEVSLAFGDDMLNQLLFAIWWGGALQLTLDEAVLGDVGETLSGYGITEATFNIDFFLAPMLSDCNDEQVLQLAVGDLYIQGNFKMLGQPISIGLFATARGDATLTLEEDDNGVPAFSVTVAEISLFEYEIVSVSEGFEGLVPIIEDLLQGEVLEDALAQVAGQTFGGLQLPEIDLGSLVPGIPAGTTLAITPTGLERVFGFTELSATLD